MLRHGLAKRRKMPSSHPQPIIFSCGEGAHTRLETGRLGRYSEDGPSPSRWIKPFDVQDTRHCSLSHSHCSMSLMRRTCLTESLGSCDPGSTCQKSTSSEGSYALERAKRGPWSVSLACDQSRAQQGPVWHALPLKRFRCANWPSPLPP